MNPSRLDPIKGKKTKEEFRKFVIQHNETSQKLTDLRTKMMSISGMYPSEIVFPKIKAIK